MCQIYDHRFSICIHKTIAFNWPKQCPNKGKIFELAIHIFIRFFNSLALRKIFDAGLFLCTVFSTVDICFPLKIITRRARVFNTCTYNKVVNVARKIASHNSIMLWQFSALVGRQSQLQSVWVTPLCSAIVISTFLK